MKTPIDLQAEQTPSWERGSGELARAYQAFLIFRDLGPTRNLHATYRAWRKLKESAGTNSSESRGTTGRRIEPPANWKRWRQEFRWDARAQAWDRWGQTQLNIQIAEERKRRTEERLEREEAERGRIQNLRRKVSRAENAPLTKTVIGKEGGEVVTRDRVREYQALNKELHILEDRRYQLTESAFTGVTEKREREPAIQRVAGYFTVGDRMYDGSDPPPLPGDAPAPAKKEEDPLLIDLTGTPYEKKPVSSAKAAEPEIDPAGEELLKILTWRPK